MSHANPSGDLVVVIERALTLLVDRLQRERFGKANRERPKHSPNPNKRYVPNEVRREVVERDGLQCSYVSPDGERCQSRKFLQFDHAQAWALGGKTTAESLRIRCAAHNRLTAEQDFGKQEVADRIAEARTKAQRAERKPPESAR